jgi:hypothetical protein
MTHVRYELDPKRTASFGVPKGKRYRFCAIDGCYASLKSIHGHVAAVTIPAVLQGHTTRDRSLTSLTLKL